MLIIEVGQCLIVYSVTPMLPPPLQRKPESASSVLRPKRKIMLSPPEETNHSNLANDIINALVPAIVSAIQPAVRVARNSSLHKETPFQLEMDPIKSSSAVISVLLINAKSLKNMLKTWKHLYVVLNLRRQYYL